MNPRTLLAALGAGMLAAGVLEMTAPGLLPVRGDAVLVTIVGLLPLVLAYRAVRRRRAADISLTEPPDVEVPVPVPTPGDDLDAVLESFSAPRRYARGVRVRGLTEAAVAALTTYRGLDESAARAAVAAGAWTPDPVAAAFLATDAAVPLPARLRGLVSPGSTYWRSVRRAITAVCDVAGVDPPPDDPGRLQSALAAVTATTRAYVPYPDDVGADRRERSTATNRWRGVGGLALAAVGVGTVARSPAVALAGAIGVGYAAFAHSATPPRVPLEVDRTMATDRPAAGETVAVTLTVRNTGDRAVRDLRVVDGVPRALRVVAGSPRRACSLAPGAAVTVEYGIEARRGTHRFEPVTAIAVDRAGVSEHEARIPTTDVVTCIPRLSAVGAPVPLSRRGTRRPGRVGVDRGGDGVEFHGVRSYRAGDPVGRIDWRRLARTGRAATLEYREEDAATVVVVVDARVEAYLAPDGGHDHAVERSVRAAGRITARLLDDGDRVGFAALPDPDCWLAPGVGPAHRAALRRRLALDTAVSPLVPRDSGPPIRRAVTRLSRRLEPDHQLVVLTPLCDHDAGRVVGRLDADRPVTVVSPDPTAPRDPEGRLARVGRDVRIRSLRRRGIPVVDWPVDETLAAAFTRATRGGWTP